MFERYSHSLNTTLFGYEIFVHIESPLYPCDYSPYTNASISSVVYSNYAFIIGTAQTIDISGMITLLNCPTAVLNFTVIN